MAKKTYKLVAETYESYIVNAVSVILGSEEWEDHHAVAHISSALDCALEEAARFMTLARGRFPGLRVIITRTHAELISGA